MYKFMKNFHSYHIVDCSPWPLVNSLNLMNILLFMLMKISFFNYEYSKFLMVSILSIMLSMYLWWRDIIREGTFQGHHTMNVVNLLKLGMLMFIVSEIMFFFSFFWSYFHFSLAPDFEVSSLWPPKGVLMFNPYQIPLLNTLLLLSSGSTVTWSHHSMLNKNYYLTSLSLLMTIFLGVVFSVFQYIEYKNSIFSINDSTFGSIFFLATGFHGLHVSIGTLFLLMNLFRIMMSHYNIKHHFGFEAAAWYWHFVDVVWIYLYIFVYWLYWFFINM
uniref:Cytochrome c oxidase subunit 3 n=1 Tax=Typhlodromus pineus TaxID=3061201 RepID=A0AAU6QDV0_9ACAR